MLVAGYLHADTREGPTGLSGVNETVEAGGDDEDERSLRGLLRPTVAAVSVSDRFP